ncbi:MAG: energy transducer TonB [Cyclobacteriaceae bacterium]
MEVKKTEKADLNKKTSFFFSIGLLITMSIVVMAFEWRDSEKQDVDLMAKNVNTFEEMLEIPPTEQPPPPPPEIQQPQIIEVPDEEEIEEEIQVKFDVEVTEDTKVQQIVIQAAEPEEEVEEIFTIVEDPASPQGGMTAFYKYVGDKIKYPAQARRMGVEGRVFVQFVIDKDGSITEVVAVKGIGAGCDEEAVRILQGSPKWKPGKQRGKPVKQRMVLPITFKLG